MKLLFRASVAVTVAAVSLSCGRVDLLGVDGDPPAALADAPLRTDSAVYHLRTSEHAHELTIGMTYTNPTTGEVYIPTCLAPHPPVLEKWENGRWVHAFSPVVLGCLGSPVVIAAGDAYAYSYRVMASRRPNTFPRFEVEDVPGTYRLVWGILGTWTPDGPEPGLGTALPLEQRISNGFRIRG